MRDKWNALTSWRTQMDGWTSQDTETIQAFVAIVIIVRQRERDKSRWEGKDPSEQGTLTSWRAQMDKQVWDQRV